jgi:hypothetical protein
VCRASCLWNSDLMFFASPLLFIYDFVFQTILNFHLSGGLWREGLVGHLRELLRVSNSVFLCLSLFSLPVINILYVQ